MVEPAGNPESPEPERTDRPVLIVEALAHLRTGHFPVMFADLARALHDEGRSVTVLTSRGWASAGEVGIQPFGVRRLGVFGRTMMTLGDQLARTPRRLRRAKRPWSDVIMTVAARRLRRRLGDAEVIVTAYGNDPYIGALLAGRGSWLLYQFQPPRAVGLVGDRQWRAPSRATIDATRWIQARRRHRGDVLRIVTNGKRALSGWAAAVPELEPRQVPFAALDEQPRLADARQRLGIDPEARLALLFGSPHAGKDHQVVREAFWRLPEWRLAIAGRDAAPAYRAWRAEQLGEGPEPLLFDGYASDELRQLLMSAADLAVLSFKPDFDFDSGTLVDAIGWGIPVVCSDLGYAGEETTRLRLGPVFRAGDADSLVRAVRSAPPEIEPAALDYARESVSPSRLARLHLTALSDKLGVVPGTTPNSR